MVGVAIGGAGLLGAGGSILGGIFGGNAQGDQAKQGLDFVKRVWDRVKTDTRPLRDTLNTAPGTLNNLLGLNPGGDPLKAYLTKPFDFTMAQLENTPGYKFTLDQGLKSVQNAYAAQGLGQSGAAMKGAADYAEGLASNTFQQNFSDYLAQNQQIYNLLTGQQQMALNAELGQANVGSQSASTASGLYGALGTANAMPWAAAGNALGGIGNSVGSGYMINSLLKMPGAIP